MKRFNMSYTITRHKAFFLSLCALMLMLSFRLNAHEQVSLNDANFQNLEAANNSKSSKKSLVRNSWKPYFSRNNCFEQMPTYFMNMNVGVGFLYFDQVRGGAAAQTGTTPLKTSEMTSRLVYNKTPLVEAVVGLNLASFHSKINFMGVALSLLNQSSVTVQSYNIPRTRNSGPGKEVFSSTVNLNAVTAKLYFYLPYSMIWKKIAYSSYAALAVGPCWQTWSQIVRTDIQVGDAFNYRQKISANCFFGAEAGIKLRSLMPNLNISMLLGCKFNLWGQARSMGKADQQVRAPQGALVTGPLADRYALREPYRIKTVYQWAPFIGVAWSY